MPPTGTSNHIDNLEHHAGLRAKKVIPYFDDGEGNAVSGVTGDLAVQYIQDSVVTTTFYLGKAAVGAATSEAKWQIKRVSIVSGDVVITWADGDTNFDNIFNDRESLTYT